MEYSASFTAGGLLVNEFESILPLLLEGNGADDLELGSLQIQSESARKRIGAEIKKRLPAANENFWLLYESADVADRRLMLFLLCLKTYRLVMEFHFEVSVKAARKLQWTLDPYDYELYLADLTGMSETVASWTEKTGLKTISNYLRMLRESGLAHQYTLQKGRPSSVLKSYLLEWDNEWFLDACFLTENEKNF